MPTNHDRLTTGPRAPFPGLTWAQIHRLADRRWAEQIERCGCDQQRRQCDGCRGIARAALAIIIAESDDSIRGVPRSMGAAALRYQTRGGPLGHVSLRIRATLLRGGARLRRRTRLDVLASVERAAAARHIAPQVTESTSVPGFVAILGWRDRAARPEPVRLQA